MKTINGNNYFNEEGLKRMIDALEQGEEITIYIDCIGFTRAEIAEWHYKQALREKYGDKLIEGKDKFGSATFQLAGIVKDCAGIKPKRKARRKKGE